MNRKLLLLPLMLALMGPAPLLAQDTTTGNGDAQGDSQDKDPGTDQMTTTDPVEFVKMAMSANMFEIESSRLALDRSQNAELRAFAQQMIDDHTKAGDMLIQLAKAAALPVPPDLSTTDLEEMNRLQSSQDFDRDYLSAQSRAHDRAVALFQGFGKDGPAEAELGALRDFASVTVPKLIEHQLQAHRLSGD